MNPFTMIFLVVAVSVIAGVCGEAYKHRLNAGANEAKKLLDDISKRMTRVEERMANIETIVLDKEREKRFSDLDK